MYKHQITNVYYIINKCLLNVSQSQHNKNFGSHIPQNSSVMNVSRPQNFQLLLKCIPCYCNKFNAFKHFNYHTHKHINVQLPSLCTFYSTSKGHHQKVTELKTPDLVYFPQVMRWLKTKIGFKVLQKYWDSEFSEGAFIYGSTQAICRITEVISNDDKNDELKGLVTPNLRKKLQLDIKRNLNDIQKKIIVLRPKDIKLLIPIQVRLNQIQERKQASVALRALAVKWQELNGSLRLAIIALQTEFIRDYTDHELDTKNSAWTVRIFDILQCGIAGEVKGSPRDI